MAETIIGCIAVVLATGIILWTTLERCFGIQFPKRWLGRGESKAELESTRKANASRHPSVFDLPPPENIHGTHQNFFDLYDATTCTHIGQVSREDLRAYIDQYLDSTPDLAQSGQNDIFTAFSTFDPSELQREYGISPEFAKILVEKDDLVVRWLPVA